MSRSRIVVVGAGILGIATAWELQSRGEAVLIVESAADIALETSYANGAMMTASMPDPWNGPGVFRHLAASLFNPFSPMKLRLRAIPTHIPWGIRFLRNSNPRLHQKATQDIYQLAAYSVSQTNELRDSLQLDYDASSTGTLKLFRNDSNMGSSRAISERLAAFGLRYEILDRQGTVAKEPQLGTIEDQISGAIFYPDDEVGDARKFCLAVADEFKSIGGEIQLDSHIQTITTNGDKVTGLKTQDDWLPADRVVMAAGHGSVRLAQQVGVKLPIKPAKGYSVTLARDLADPWPRIPVLDDAMHAGIVPLGDRLRMVGTAEFTGYDAQLRKARVDNLYKLLEVIYPNIATQLDLEAGVPWTGFRPMTTDGRPFIGAAGPAGLYLNTGHGHLGWTLAVGSAKLLADQLLDTKPAVDPLPFQYQT